MTVRAVSLGLLLALSISLGTYFNDWKIGQTQLIGNFLPISVFGLSVLFLLVLNPLAHRLGKGLPLKKSEIAVMVALGLASCGFPGSNFYRGFVVVTALPAHWLKTNPSWQASHVMSYVPGGSSELGQGHVLDWPRLVRETTNAGYQDPDSPAGRLFRNLGEEGQRLFRQTAEQGRVEVNTIAELTRSVNLALRSPALFEGADGSWPEHEIVAHNRARLARVFDGAVLPAPRGEGALLDGGRADSFLVDTLMQGRGSNQQLGIAELPWRAWWPTMRLWGSVALLLGVCALCLALVVHPQWARRELLPYPIARFLDEASARRADSGWPEVTTQKLFWVGFSVVLFWHLLNGLHAWFPEIPEMPFKQDLWALTELFPNAARVNGQYGWFGPTIFLSVVAFSFFMSTSASFSLGIAHVLFMLFGALMVRNGLQLDGDGLGTKRSNLLRFGAYVAYAAMIVYTGRHYYKAVLLGALGRPRSAETPPYAVWAARGLVVASVLSTLALSSSGLGFFLSGLFVFLVLLTFVVMTRMVCETGAFFVQTSWAPVGVMTALFGFDAIGPTPFVLLALASVLLVLDPRETLMPFLQHGLKLTDVHGGAAPGRIVPWLLGVVLVGFIVAGVASFSLQYNLSATQVGNTWGTHQLPTVAFSTLSRFIAESSARGSLAEATAANGWQSLALLQPIDDAVWWTLLGGVLVLGVSVARLRLPWWPLHPIAFLIWDTYPIAMFGVSFLLGWMVKASVVGLTGARGYHLVKPLMIGVIAGELLSGLFWMATGIGYYLVTGQASVSYSIFPR